MINNNEDDSGHGLGKPKKPKWKKHINFKNAIKLAVAPQLLIPKKHLTVKNVAKAAFAPHLLIPKKHLTVKNVTKAAFAPQLLLIPKKKGHSRKAPVAVKRAAMPIRVVTPEPQAEPEAQVEPEEVTEHEPQAEPEAEAEQEPQSATEQEEGGDEIGLGKSKMLRKINLKGTLKVVKFAAPLMSMIPVVGGPASKLMDSQLGRFATKAANSKAGKAAKAFSKSKMGKQVINSAKARLLGDNPQADAEAGTEAGTTPLKEAETPKNNTVLYVAGAAALLGVAYMATRKK